ncbi:MAG: hypothetical protein U0350_51065 [Caldilineaceae bacterium]
MAAEPTIETTPDDEEFVWETFLTDLVDYVRLELAGQAVGTLYPALTFHINTSPECLDAYYRELHQQSLAYVAARRAANQPTPASALVQTLLGGDASAPLPPVSPNWIERVIEHGRAWLDQGATQWRQLQLSLAALQTDLNAPPLLTGMMGGHASTAHPQIDSLHIAPEDSNFEVIISIASDPAFSDPARCQLEVLLTLFERLGDYAGVGVTLWSPDRIDQAQTDAEGRVIFTGLRTAQIKEMRVIVSLP